MRRWVVVLALAASCNKDPRVEVAPKGVKVAVDGVTAARVRLEANGAVTLEGQPVKLEELSERLRAMRTQTPSIEVHVEAAESVPYPKVIEALDAAQKAGIMGVSLDSPKAGEAPQQH